MYFTLIKQNGKTITKEVIPETEQDEKIIEKVLMGHPRNGEPLTDDEVDRLDYLRHKENNPTLTINIIKS